MKQKNQETFNMEQESQLFLGVCQKVDIRFYYNPNFCAEQMQQIRLGLRNGLAKKKVSKYATTRFSALQMEQIRLGFENNLTMEEVSVYAFDVFTFLQMRAIRIAIENNLSEEQILTLLEEYIKSNKTDLGEPLMDKIKTYLEKLNSSENTKNKELAYTPKSKH